MFRRALLLAPMLVLLWIGGASAQVPPDDYPPTVPTSNVPTSLVSTTVPPGTAPPEVPDDEEGGEVREAGDLARTGADNIWPLIQAAIVLLGGGTLLVLVARRRRAERRATA